jgi:flagellar protein FlaI
MPGENHSSPTEESTAEGQPPDTRPAAHSTTPTRIATDGGAATQADSGAAVADPDVGLEPDAGRDAGEDLLLPMRRQQAANPGDQYEVEDRYWLNPPFAYAMVLRHRQREDYEYRVVEPPISEYERTLYQTLLQELKDHLLYRTDPDEEADRGEQLERNVRRALDELGLNVEESSVRKILYYLQRDMIDYGKIDPLMHDSRLEEIHINGPGIRVFVYHRDYEDVDTNIVFDSEDRLSSFVSKIAQRSGTDISVAEPMEGTALPDGSRVQLSLRDEVTTRGSTATIRKFREEPFSPVELVQYGTFSLEQMAYLWMLISNGYSGIVAGGTGSGKTSTLNACSMFVPPKSKIVSIEDTREVQLPHDNWIPALTREGFSGTENSIDMGDLLKAALRQRPEYMVVGEVRDEEAYAMFQAMNTGHTTYSTMHADSVTTAVSRLENPPMGVERELISELGFLSIQNVAHVDGEKVRRNNKIVEVIGLDDERDLNYRTVFDWNEATDEIRKVSESKHAQQLRNEGKNPEKMLEDRYTVLNHLLENGITDYDPVTTVVSTYDTAPGVVLEMVENGDLDFSRLERLNNQPEAATPAGDERN